MKQIIKLFIEELKKDKNTKGILIFGSYARGDQRKTSDIDILVLVNKGAWRDVKIRDDQIFEIVYSSLKNAKDFYQDNQNNAVRQWADVNIIFDRDGEMKKLKKFVSKIRKKGKPKLNKKQINHLKFDKEDKIRAIKYLKNKDFATANLQLQRLGQEMLEIYFDLNQLWTPAPKQILGYLRKHDKKTSKLFDDFFKKEKFETQLKTIKKIVSVIFANTAK